MRRAVRAACRHSNTAERAGSAGGPKPGRAGFYLELGRCVQLTSFLEVHFAHMNGYRVGPGLLASTIVALFVLSGCRSGDMELPNFGKMQCDGFFVDRDRDTFVATVVRTQDTPATNGEPPVVTLRVENVLNGTLPEHELRAKWRALSPFWCDVGEDVGGWRSMTLIGPKLGHRLLVTGYEIQGTYQIDGSCARSATLSNVRAARKAIARERQDNERAERNARTLQAAELRLEATADLERLYRTSDAVLIGTRSGGPSADVLEVRVVRRIKNTELQGQSTREFARIRLSKAAYSQMQNRIDDLNSNHLVFFLRVLPNDLPPATYLVAQFTSIDHHLYGPTDDTFGILRETDAISDFLLRLK
jgi:hypothetical protein